MTSTLYNMIKSTNNDFTIRSDQPMEVQLEDQLEDNYINNM
jgi:hypothetical protein